jgi:xanthine dehydrogenase molybdenum-binding subunit
MSEDLKVIGQYGKTKRRHGFSEATGTQQYARDVQLDGMAYVKFVGSPYAHARVVSVDKTRAEAYPGVLLVFSFLDEEFTNYTIVQNPGFEVRDFGLWESCPVLVGVVAEDEQTANEAVQLIDVEWEELPFYLDPEKAIESGASLSNSTLSPESNILMNKTKSKGDVDAAFSAADVIVEEKLTWPRLYQAAGEVDSWLYSWDGDELTAYIHTQTAPELRAPLATWFNIPVSKVNVVPLKCGGGFGGACFNNQFIAAALAKKLKRPVRMQFNRVEDHIKTDFAPRTNLKYSASQNGEITALQANTVFDMGAGCILWVLNDTFACYWFWCSTKCPNISENWNAVLVNNPFTISFRCEMNNTVFVLNKVTEGVAWELEKDPTEIALLNTDDPGTSLKTCIENGKAQIGWDDKWHLPGTKTLDNGKLHGMGFAWCVNWGANAMAASAGGSVNPDGSVSLFLSRSDVGNSPFETYAMAASEVLGIPADNIHWGRDSNAGFGLAPNCGSWGSTANVSVVREVAEKLKAKLMQFAVTHLGVSEDEIAFADGTAYVINDTSKKYTIAELIALGGGSAGAETDLQSTGGAIFATVDTRYTPMEPDHFNHEDEHSKNYQAQFCEVEVDPETGAVEVIQSVVVNDVGQALRPESVHGQQYGGFCMGWGRNLSEECIYDSTTGAQLNNNLLDYKYSTILDVGDIDPIIVESKQGPGEYGNIGIGELPAVVGGVVVNMAVCNAIGKRILKNPIYPQDILAALGKI